MTLTTPPPARAPSAASAGLEARRDRRGEPGDGVATASRVLSPWPEMMATIARARVDGPARDHLAQARRRSPRRRSRRRRPRSRRAGGCTRAPRRRRPRRSPRRWRGSRRGRRGRRRGCRWPASARWSGRLTGVTTVGAGREAPWRSASSPAAWAPKSTRRAALDQPDRDELAEALGDLRELAARGDRHDDLVGQAPAELLGDLEGEGLGALGVVGPDVHVGEGPVGVLGRRAPRRAGSRRRSCRRRRARPRRRSPPSRSWRPRGRPG